MNTTEQACQAYLADENLTIAATARRYGMHCSSLIEGMRRRGIKSRLPQGGLKRELAGSWKGGRRPDAHGYIRLLIMDDEPKYIHDMKNRDGYVLEHRYAMAKALGRSLTRKETVHHINGERTDNRLENLQLRNGRHGKGIRLVCACCGSSDIKEVPIN